MVVKKNGWVKLVSICLMLSLVLGFGGLIVPGAAGAAEISVTVTGDGVTTPTTFTLEDLQNLPQVQTRLYSTINTWPTKKWYIAEGPRLSELLTRAGIKAEAKSIKIISTDTFTKSLTREQLDAPRYYYPGLKENHEYFGYILGSPEGAAPVDTILALRSANSTNPDHMSSTEAPLLVMGQRWITEQTNELFVKYVGTIEVSTATPAKWESPAADKESGTVPAGAEIALSTSNMDGDSIHYTTDGSDPTIKSPMYNWIKKRWWGSRSDELADINHTIKLTSDTTIKATAIGAGKEDSDIVTFDYLVPFGSAGKGDMIYVAGKNTHTVAIKNDGTVWAWGDGQVGKLGDGTTGPNNWRSVPGQVYGLTEVTAVAPGDSHTLALKNDGTVWAWGYNLYGQLGIGVSGSKENRTIPEQVYGLTGVQAIAAGSNYSLAIKNDGTVWAWGGNSDGQLGNGLSGLGKKSTVPEQVYGLTDVKAIAAGKDHTLALKNEGTVWAWGKNNCGQLGIGTTENSTVPEQVYGLTDVKAIAAGGAMSFAVKSNGTAWGWGMNSSGQLGPDGPKDSGYSAPSSVPVQVTGLTDVKTIAVGENQVISMKNDGTVWVWGSNIDGQLGNELQSSEEPVQLCGTEANIAMINAGIDYSLAVKNDGTVWAWGNNSKGKLGDGSTKTYPDNRYVPTQVKRAPREITPAVEAVTQGEAVELVFADDADWREFITSVIVDRHAVNYTVSEGKITIEADVFTEAKDYDITVKSAGYVDSFVIQQIKAELQTPPALVADTTDNTIGNSIEIIFEDNEAWRNAITGVTVNDSAVASEKYSVAAGKLTINDSVFVKADTYTIVVKATGYSDATVEQQINEAVVHPETPQYKVIPAEDAVYTIGATADGIKTMTVNADQTGFKYFTVSVEPVKAHDGTETAVFTHLRNDIQLEINAAVADFDVINTAKAGFNVNPGDVIKVYIVDQLTNDSDLNPVILQ